MKKPRKRLTILYRQDAEKIFESWKVVSAAYSQIVSSYFMDDKNELCAALSHSLILMQKELNNGGFHISGELGNPQLEYDGATHET